MDQMRRHKVVWKWTVHYLGNPKISSSFFVLCFDGHIHMIKGNLSNTVTRTNFDFLKKKINFKCFFSIWLDQKKRMKKLINFLISSSEFHNLEMMLSKSIDFFQYNFQHKKKEFHKNLIPIWCQPLQSKIITNKF